MLEIATAACGTPHGIISVENPTTFGTYRLEVEADREVLDLDFDVTPAKDGASASSSAWATA